jgi:hypothetical protein
MHGDEIFDTHEPEHAARKQWKEGYGVLRIHGFDGADCVCFLTPDDGALAVGEHILVPIHMDTIGESDEEAEGAGLEEQGGLVGLAALTPHVVEKSVGTDGMMDEPSGEMVEIALIENADAIFERCLFGHRMSLNEGRKTNVR